MAYITGCHCLKCGKNWRGAVGAGMPTPKECGECESKRKDIERREHFSGLDGLTTEERLRRIEEWIYNYRPPSTQPARF